MVLELLIYAKSAIKNFDQSEASIVAMWLSRHDLKVWQNSWEWLHSQVSSICVAVFLNKHIAGEQLGKFKCKMQAIKKVRRGWMCCITLQHAVLRWCWLTHEDDVDNMQWDEEGWKRTQGKPIVIAKGDIFHIPVLFAEQQ